MKPQALSVLKHPAVNEKLKRLHDAPRKIFYLGSTELEDVVSRPTIAIVGSRIPTAYGKTVTTNFASYFARQGITIVSGLALGIDALAHQATVENHGTTLAILPCGLHRIYPASHRNLAQRIIQQGGLVSEYENDDAPQKHQFIARNRIIAGFADALLIPEAAEKSGSLHTAGFALDIGIPVFAVPGPITSLLSKGTNELLRHGATPALSPEQMLEELDLVPQTDKQLIYLPKNPEESVIIGLLLKGENQGAVLQQKSKMPATEFHRTMTMLEINGVIRPLGNDMWSV